MSVYFQEKGICETFGKKKLHVHVFDRPGLGYFWGGPVMPTGRQLVGQSQGAAREAGPREQQRGPDHRGADGGAGGRLRGLPPLGGRPAAAELVAGEEDDPRLGGRAAGGGLRAVAAAAVMALPPRP